VNSPRRSGFTVGGPSGAMLLNVVGRPAVLKHAPAERGIHAGYSLASRRASHFSLRAQRKVTKRKSTPIQRSPGSATAPCVALPPASMQSSCPPTPQRDSGGSPTVHPWTGVELGAIPCAHPSGFPSVTLPLHRGPIHCASCAVKTKQTPARVGIGFGFALGSGAHDARYRGPVARGEAAQELSEGWPTRRGPVRRQSMDGLSANPGAASRTRSTGTVRRARVWGGLLFAYFLLATQEKVGRSPKASESSALPVFVEYICHAERSDSLAGRRVKTRHGCRATKERASGKQSHWTPACAGVTRDEGSVKDRHGCRAAKRHRDQIKQSHSARAFDGATPRLDQARTQETQRRNPFASRAGQRR
jgi:hypothetical protein